jgi:hypothetical protein
VSGGSRVRLWLVAAATIVLLLPFAGDAFRVDDPLFLWTARQVQRVPIDFYGFDVNWYGSPLPMHEVTQNPPLAGYYIALFALFGGFGEVVLHLAFLLPALAVTLGTWRLARRWVASPWVAAAFVLSTPVFLMSAVVLTSDLMMLAFWIWAVELWLRGLDEDSNVSLGGAAMLVALAGLTKYFAISLVPLLAVHAWHRGRPRSASWLTLPVAVWTGYELLTRSLYGHGLLTQAGGYTGTIFEIDRMSDVAVMLQKLFVGIVFAGGCLLTVLFFAPWLWTRRPAIAGVLSAAIAAIALVFAPKLYGFPLGDAGWTTKAQLLLLFLSGLGVIALAAARLGRDRSADGVLLALWALGTLLFATAVNWTVNGRSVLPAVPAIGILLARRLELHGVAAKPARRLLAPLLAGALVAFGVAWGDGRQAGTARVAAREIAERYAGETPIWFQGHWGFQWYMERQGGRAVDLAGDTLPAGSLMVLPENNTSTLRLPEPAATRIDTMVFPVRGFIATMSPERAASYYAARVRGPLPFAFGPGPAERYTVYRINRAVKWK